MSPFEKAFATARKSGKKEFTFAGKSYNTKLKEEAGGSSTNSPSPKARPKSTASTGPKARPKAASIPSPMTPPRPKEGGPMVPPRADSPSYMAKKPSVPRATKRVTPKAETEAERNSRLDRRMRNAKGKF